MQVFVLLFATMIGTACGLTCYQCNSHNDTACDDFFSDESEALRSLFEVTCPPTNLSEPQFCRKTKMYHYTNEGTKVRVYRDCGYGFHPFGHYSCYPVISEDFDIKVCQCYEDNCNGALQVGVGAPLLVAAVAAAASIGAFRATA